MSPFTAQPSERIGRLTSAHAGALENPRKTTDRHGESGEGAVDSAGGLVKRMPPPHLRFSPGATIFTLVARRNLAALMGMWRRLIVVSRGNP